MTIYNTKWLVIILKLALFPFSVSAQDSFSYFQGQKCITLSSFPTPFGLINGTSEKYDDFFSPPFTTMGLSYNLFNREGMLLSSGKVSENSTDSIECFSDKDVCRYLLLEGHGRFMMGRWDNEQEVMEEGTISLDAPKLLRFGSCTHLCGHLQEIVFAGTDDDNPVLLVNNMKAAETSVCMHPESCYKLVGNAAYIVTQDTNTVVERGNTWKGYKEFGGTSCQRSICSDKPLLTESPRGQELTVVLSSISGMEFLSNVDSPQYKAACWLIHDDLRKLQVSDPSVIQRYVLAVLYYTWRGADWDRNYDFLTYKDECEWKRTSFYGFQKSVYNDGDGVLCNDSGDVRGIRMEANNLVGIVPRELARLSNVGYILLGENALSGTIPHELGYLTNMKQLGLGMNRLHGRIPDSIAKMQSLQRLQLGTNMLTGTIPKMSESLSVELDLRNNLLTGNIPNQIGNLTSLQSLWLFDNQLTGSIPQSIANMKNLLQLTSNNNELSGPIPPQLLTIETLRHVELSHNKLSGSIPNQVSIKNTLFAMLLGFNQLTGTIPSQLSAFKSLEYLDIQNNRLTGTFPLEIAEFRNLSYGFVNDNELTGIIPFENCKQFSHLEADCETPVEVLCPCCTSCHGQFSARDDSIMGCTTGVLELTFSNLKRTGVVDFELMDRMGFVVNRLRFTANETKQSFSSCISTTECFQLYLFRLSKPEEILLPLDLEVAVDKRVILKENITKTGLNYSFGYWSEGVMRQNTCDDLTFCQQLLHVDSNKREVFNRLTRITSFADLNDETSVQSMAACDWLNYVDLREEQDSVRMQSLSVYVLLIFYYSTNGKEWNNSTFWLSDEHICNWYGVECNSFDLVNSLNMDSNGLKGRIPTEVGALASLKKLSLINNKLFGTIPPHIGAQLANLQEVDLSHNFLSGRIPSEFKYLGNLLKLDLSHNRLTGELPVDMGHLQSLSSLNLYNNSFNGNIPDSFYNLTQLKMLSVGDNLFAGNVNKITNMNGLEKLDLNGNFFTGYLPLSEKLSNLRSLRLSGNSFRGLITTRIEKLQFLEELLLHDNQLTGSLPSRIGNLQYLSRLTVSHNKLKGTIPESIGNIKSLTLLHLHDNALNGPADFFDYQVEDFIADCGNGNTIFDSAPVKCNNCTICCNVDGDCISTNSTWPKSRIKSSKLKPYISVSTFILVGSVGGVCLVFLYHCIAGRKRGIKFNEFQEGSAYRLFLSGSFPGAFIGCATVILQLLISSLFLQMSDFTEESNDWHYPLVCPRDSLTCKDTRYITSYGWLVFMCIFIVFITKDVIEAFQIIYKSIESYLFRGIFAGFIVLVVTGSTVTTSFLYNNSTATSNTDIIKDAVILLFLLDLDEKVYEITSLAFGDWIDNEEKKIKQVLRECHQGRINTRSATNMSDIDPADVVDEEESISIDNDLKSCKGKRQDDIKALTERVFGIECSYKEMKLRNDLLTQELEDTKKELDNFRDVKKELDSLREVKKELDHFKRLKEQYESFKTMMQNLERK